jgi:hypothetical protein
MSGQYSGECPAPKSYDSDQAKPPSGKEGTAETKPDSPGSAMEGFDSTSESMGEYGQYGSYLEKELAYRTEPAPGGS